MFKNLARSVIPVVGLSVALAGISEFSVSAPALAQKSSPVQLKHASFAPVGAKEVISPDGLLMAYFRDENPSGLYVKNLSTGEEKLIAKGPGGIADWEAVSGLSFSPDGSLFVLSAGPAREFEGKIYIIRTDGSSIPKAGEFLVPIASDSKGGGHSSKGPASKPNDIALSNPQFSPDGSKILVDVLMTSGRRDAEHRIDHSDDKTYVGVLSRDGIKQTPEQLVEGKPLFWSHDGSAVYYTTPGAVNRYDMASKQAKAVLDISKSEVVGRVPGTDALFAVDRNQSDAPLTVISLDGSPISQSLKDSAAALPRKDADGRLLSAVEDGGPHKLTLRYKPSFEFVKGGVSPDLVGRLQESGKLDGAMQRVSFQ
jgi:Tol biopolymer transport system component